MTEGTATFRDDFLRETYRSKIYLRTYDSGDKAILKVLNLPFPSPLEISQFNNEWRISKEINIPGIRSVRERIKFKGQPALLMDYIPGIPLSEIYQKPTMDLSSVLQIAIHLCQVLGDFHNKNLLHLDINADNILIDKKNQCATIIDLELASKVDSYQKYLGNPNELQGNIYYISPEQTGRMNRKMDHRSDLYSLGICLYQMISGKPPFEGKEAIELVHAHIAVAPPPLLDQVPHLPEPVQKIILKLLAKNAEDRYQSAFGVKADLERCLSYIKKQERVPEFQLSDKHITGKFLLPQKLYGREREVQQLMTIFNHSASGTKEIAMISGYSGTGKSVLVHETHKPITARHGYFITGKYDQYQRSTPYYAILESLKQYIAILLTETDENLKDVKEKIQSAIGEEGKVLTEVLPNLQHLIGEQPEVPQLGPTESKARMNYVLSKFITHISSPAHPIVMFLDDLQWADAASLKFLESYMSSNEGGFFLCLGAYRNNEVSAAHPLAQSLEEIESTGKTVHKLEIGNLKQQHLIQMISDATSRNPKKAFPLAELVFNKTRGNAFFAVEFLESIAREGLIFIDRDHFHWDWNIQKIKNADITDNVVDFLVKDIIRLNSDTLELLKTAACIGHQFDSNTLHLIHEISKEKIRETLFPAIKKGLVIQIDYEDYKFSHDRIHQAVYSLPSAEEKKSRHFQIGKMLFTSLNSDEKHQRLFEITDQLNLGSDLIEETERRLTLARLNLKAGQRAKNNSAFSSASDYFSAGLKQLPEDAWTNCYNLALALNTEACEAAYLCGLFQKMEEYFVTVEKKAKGVLDKLKAYETLILAKKAQNKLLDAIYTGLDILEELGEPLPRKPNKLHIFSGLASTMLRLRGKSREQLLNLPIMKDPEKIAAMRIIANITSSVYWALPNMTPLVVFKMIRISLKYGNNAVSCFAYGSYGVILCGVLGMMKRGNQFGELSLELLERLDAKEWKAQIYVSPYALIFHWNGHVDQTLKPLRDSWHIGMETGLVEFACVNTNIYCIHAFLSGKSLNRIEKETQSYSENYKQLKQETNLSYNEVYRQAMLNFMGKAKDPKILSGTAYDEKKMRLQNKERNDQTGLFFIHFLSSMLHYYFGDAKRSLDESSLALPLLDAVLGKFEIPNLFFYRGLAAAQLAKNDSQKRRKYKGIAKSAARKLKKWAKNSPENYRHKYHLIVAELHAVNTSGTRAFQHYEKAIEDAAKHGFIHEEALARELTAKYAFRVNREEIGTYYLKTAYSNYHQWQAQAKIQHLEQSFPTIINDNWLQSKGSFTGSHANTISGYQLDISTVIKSATSISGEVVLSDLLAVLIHLAIENAGAQRGLFFLKNDEGKWYIEAEKDISNNTEQILQHREMTEQDDLPLSVIQYVIRTRERLVLDQAIENQQFARDPYLQKYQLRSLMALPILNQGKLIGVLYLENRSAAAAFTHDRVELLSLLSTQIAISIDNALLYENLEQKVRERTFELSKEKKKTDELLYNILPFETAEELKKSGSAKPRFYESVSVLFTDFVDFTARSTDLKPNELVVELDEFFGTFDRIMDKYGIEKIKTIGDAYMAAGGLPVVSHDHPLQTVRAAIEICEFVQTRKQKNNGNSFDVRIGIHTGPVVSGIVGQKKFQYDIWGDTVNTAARMESHGTPGKINLSHATYALIKDYYPCESRGKVSVKGKGETEMYYLDPTQIKP